MKTTASEAVFLGLKLYEFLTLIGVFLGPIVAVLITLWVDRRRRRSDAQIQVLRMILTTRRLPSDPAYLAAINLIEVEFNKCADVMQARREYLSLARTEVSEERQLEHDQLMNAKQATMIYGMMKAVGLKGSESDILTDAYTSRGFLAREGLYIDSLKATCDVAEALKVSNWLMAKSLGLDGGSNQTAATPDDQSKLAE